MVKAIDKLKKVCWISDFNAGSPTEKEKLCESRIMIGPYAIQGRAFNTAGHN